MQNEDLKLKLRGMMIGAGIGALVGIIVLVVLSVMVESKGNEAKVNLEALLILIGGPAFIGCMFGWSSGAVDAEEKKQVERLEYVDSPSQVGEVGEVSEHDRFKEILKGLEKLTGTEGRKKAFDLFDSYFKDINPDKFKAVAFDRNPEGKSTLNFMYEGISCKVVAYWGEQHALDVLTRFTKFVLEGKGFDNLTKVEKMLYAERKGALKGQFAFPILESALEGAPGQWIASSLGLVLGLPAGCLLGAIIGIVVFGGIESGSIGVIVGMGIAYGIWQKTKSSLSINLAIDHYKTKVERDQAETKSLSSLVALYGAKGDWLNALEYSRRMASIDPKARLILIKSLNNCGRENEGMEILSQLVQEAISGHDITNTGLCECCDKKDFPEKDLVKIDSGQLLCPNCLKMLRG